MSKLPKIKKNIKGFGIAMPKFKTIPASAGNLPAKIPKQGTIDLRKLKKKKKFDRMFEEMMEEKRVIRSEKAKKIAWNKIDDYEYEVILKGIGSELSIGKVKRSIRDKWTICPSFEPGGKSFRYNLAVKEEFYDWHKAGHAMIELWIVT